jgi:hypothetical protein
MNTKIILAAVAIVAAFSIAAVVGPVSIATPAVAQNMTGDNMTAGGGNMTGMGGDNMTGMSPPPTP